MKRGDLNSSYFSARNEKFTDTEIEEVCHHLSEESKLTILSLCHVPLTHNQVELIALALSNNSKLITLELDDVGICDAGAAALASALRKNTTLTLLDLAWNNIGDAGAFALASVIPVTTSLYSFDLLYNNIGSRGQARLAEAYENSASLRYLFCPDDAISQDLVRLENLDVSRLYNTKFSTMSNLQKIIHEDDDEDDPSPGPDVLELYRPEFVDIASFQACLVSIAENTSVRSIVFSNVRILNFEN